MSKALTLSVPLIVACVMPCSAQQAERTRFWNLTGATITHFYLAPAGTGAYGADQTVNDKDGTVDHDERLRITDARSGRYDVKFEDDSGRVCIVKDMAVKAGDVFSIRQAQLTNCRK